MLKTKVYVVKDADGNRSLVKAFAKAGACRFKREQTQFTAEVATQQELIEMIGVVPVESVEPDSGQTDIED